MKSEPDVFSFDDLMSRPERTEGWDGVRNYQARNFMRDDMRVGDPVLFYHSNTKPPHVAGLARVASAPRPDRSALDPRSEAFDEKATEEDPRWVLVDVQGVVRLERPVALAQMRDNPRLADMPLVRRGNRLSILPVTDEEFEEVLRMAETPCPPALAPSAGR